MSRAPSTRVVNNSLGLKGLIKAVLVGGTGAVTITALVASAGGASAHHYGTFQNCYGVATSATGTVGCEGSLTGSPDQNGAWRAPTNLIDVAERSISSTSAAALTAAMDHYRNETEIDPLILWDQAECTANRFTHCVYDDTYGNNGFRGWNSCNQGSVRQGTNPNRICGTQSVKRNQTYTDTPAQKTWCHEFGHALGLQHSEEPANTTCMSVATSSNAYKFLSNHDKSEINNRY